MGRMKRSLSGDPAGPPVRADSFRGGMWLDADCGWVPYAHHVGSTSKAKKMQTPEGDQYVSLPYF